MKPRIGLSFFLCLVITVVLVQAQDDATEIVDTDTNDNVNSDIAKIEDVKEEVNEDDDDYDYTVPVEETPPSEVAKVEDVIIEDPVENIKEAESVEQIATNDETNVGTAPKPAPKSRSGNYQYGDEFFGNLDIYNTDVNGGGDPNYNYGKLESITY